MHDIISQLTEKQASWDREKHNLVAAREAAVTSLYKLRTHIDEQTRKKIAPETILAEIHEKLKKLTPHGANMTCD
jgi:predicted RNA-binding Zn ribbon-like protein